MNYGLSSDEIERVIRTELNKNPDLPYYINNAYFDEYMALLIDGISKAIEENGKAIFDEINHQLRRGQMGIR